MTSIQRRVQADKKQKAQLKEAQLKAVRKTVVRVPAEIYEEFTKIANKLEISINDAFLYAVDMFIEADKRKK